MKHCIYCVTLEKHSQHTAGKEDSEYACECFSARALYPQHFPDSRDDLCEKCGLTAMAGGGFEVENSEPIQHTVDEKGELWFMKKNTGL